ncbi:MAG TPA: radical SAM protein [Spirochaetota bacterium]|nr:radical SAM protein [Spirochaetota bacterium]
MSTAHTASLEPFETCSIRPPTENASLSFRLTRNCHWNKCAFCPVYKCGARFSRRSLDEVFADIERARALDDYLYERGIGFPVYTPADYARAAGVAEEIGRARREAGVPDPVTPEGEPAAVSPRMRWFMQWFRDRPSIEDCVSQLVSWRIAGGTTCFLGDSDGLALKADFLCAVLRRVRERFGTVRRFTVYGRTRSAARLRTLRELERMREAGLDRVHFGLESGSDRVLAAVRKGATSRDHVDGCRTTREAGLSCSVYVMPGLGGASLSDEHAHETARVLSLARPEYVRLRSLEIFPDSPLEEEFLSGRFVPCTEEQVVREIRVMIEESEGEMEIASDSASNLLDLYGRLPEDRPAMLEEIDRYLALSPRGKLEFSLVRRLRAFAGQYGGLSDDVDEAVLPLVGNGRIDLSRADDALLSSLIALIRGKLMP